MKKYIPVAMLCLLVFLLLVFGPGLIRSKLLKVDGCGGKSGLYFWETASYAGLLYSDRRGETEYDYYANCSGELQLVRWYDSGDRKVKRVVFQWISREWNTTAYQVETENGPIWVIDRGTPQYSDWKAKFDSVRAVIDKQ